MQDSVRAQILSIKEQLSWKPISTRKINTAKAYVLAGMGGSHLAADLLKSINPSLPIVVHKDYGLPENLPKGTTLIACSYSGNTAETLSAYETARKKKIGIIAISSGGKLETMATKDKLPHIKLQEGFQPRMATVFMMSSILLAMGESEMLKKLFSLAKKMDADSMEEEGLKLAAWYKNSFPIIYSSSRYFASAYCMKIALNETGKIPAFCNAFPELNHNEMNGFGGPEKDANAKYKVLILKFPTDDKRILLRMDATAKLLKAQGVEVMIREAKKNPNPFWVVLEAMVVGEWTAAHLATSRGADPEGVPMVEDLKKIMKGK